MASVLLGERREGIEERGAESGSEEERESGERRGWPERRGRGGEKETKVLYLGHIAFCIGLGF